MSNALLNASAIAKEALREFKNQLTFTKGINRQYDSEFAKSGAKIGNTINIRKPQRYEVTDGAVLNVQNIQNDSVALVLDKRKHVAFQFSTQELTLNVEKFNELYLKPAVTRLANQVDFDGLGLYKSVYNSVGTPGTQPATQAEALALALGAGQKLKEFSCPSDDMITACLNPASEAALVKGLAGLTESSKQIGKQYEKGKMFDALGMSWKMDQNVNVHTTGNVAGAPAIDTTISANGTATFHLDGLTGEIAKVFSKGDVITVEDVYAVNPITKQSTGSLMQFVVTADTGTSTSGEIAELPISPAVYLSGPKQNVSAAPTDGKSVKLFGHATSYAAKSTPANLVYHKDAFVLGCADLEMPQGVHMASRASDPDSGLSIRFVSFYDGVNDVIASRLDILYGWKEMYPEWACRIHG